MKQAKTTAAFALGLLAALGAYARAQTTLCAVVKLEILQKATFEREAFDAHLAVANSLPATPLTNFKVQIFFTDPNGNNAGSLFFVKTSTLTNINAVDGTGVIQSSTTADIHWLIIPSSGAGGSFPSGIQYSVTATITAQSGSSAQNITTFPALITVNPQPLLKLEYALPYEVFGQEPLITQIEPIVPYPLAVRATNIGYGTAGDFQIQSAQPVILDNKQGLAVDFTIIGTQVDGVTIPNTLLIPFGDVASQQVVQAGWVMTSSLSGRFISFTSTFTHAASLGGQLTSLIQSVTTYTLLSTVLVDLPGRDTIPDYLVNETTERLSMQGMLDSGVQPPAQDILESDQPSPLPVTEIPGALSGTLSGANATLTLQFTSAVGPNVWVHSYAAFTYGNTVTVTSARRGDGKPLNPANVWISKHFNKNTLLYMYWLNILDLTSSTNTYIVQFEPSQLVTPPGTVTNLSAATGASGGEAALAWTAPGESGNTGYLFGGRYFLEAEIDSTTVFSPADAQVTITTNASPGDAQAFDMTGLIGNATNYFHLWTQNGGGGMSGLSNGATAYALPNPPQDLGIADVSSTSVFASTWTLGNNSLPVDYQLFVSTAAGGVVLSSSPFFDSFTSTYTFTGLPSDMALQFFGYALNPDTLAAGPPGFLGSTVTFAAPPSPSAFTGISSFSVTAHWSANGNQPDTRYQAELSTSSSHEPLYVGSLLAATTSAALTGLSPCAGYYGQVRALGRNGAYSAYADLGPVTAGSASSTPCGIQSWYVIASTGLDAYGVLSVRTNGVLVFASTTTATSTLQYLSHGSATYWVTEDSSDSVLRTVNISTTTAYGDMFLLDSNDHAWEISIDGDGVLRTTAAEGP